MIDSTKFPAVEVCPACAALIGEEPHCGDCPRAGDEHDSPVSLVACPGCGASAAFLGYLGALAYFRCRYCGVTFYGHLDVAGRNDLP